MPSARLTWTNSSGVVRPLDIDTQTNSLIVTTNEHHHIHEGYAWSITDTATLNAAGVYRYLFVTANSDWLVHFRHTVYGEGEGTFEIYEAPTYSNAGTGVTPVDRNRDNLHNPVTTVTHTPTTSALGTRLYYAAFGSGKGEGTNSASEEWVFKRGTAYLIIFTSDVAGNEISWELFWYNTHTTRIAMLEILAIIIVIELSYLCYVNSDLPRLVRGWKKSRRMRK